MPGSTPGPIKFAELILEDGQNLRLWGGGLRFVHLDGSGVPPIRRIIEKSALQDGASDRGYRLDARNMTLQLHTDLTFEDQVDNMRDRIAYAFGPTDSPLQLRITRMDDTVRQIDCFVNGEVDFPQSRQIGTGLPVTVPLLAPNPIWYNPTQQTYTHTITNGSSSFDVDTTGWTWEDWPILDITGPIDTAFAINITPTSAVGGSQFVFQSGIPALETIRMDFRPGYKTILRTSDNANKFSYLVPARVFGFSYSKLVPPKVSVALAGSTYAAKNTVTFSAAAGTTGATQATLYWYKRYLSL